MAQARSSGWPRGQQGCPLCRWAAVGVVAAGAQAGPPRAPQLCAQDCPLRRWGWDTQSGHWPAGCLTLLHVWLPRAHTGIPGWWPQASQAKPLSPPQPLTCRARVRVAVSQAGPAGHPLLTPRGARHWEALQREGRACLCVWQVPHRDRPGAGGRAGRERRQRRSSQHQAPHVPAAETARRTRPHPTWRSSPQHTSCN